MTQYAAIVESLRATVASGRTDLAWRKDQLRALRRLLAENETALCEAVYADLRKPADEVRLLELAVLSAEIDHTLANLRRWTAPRLRPLPLTLFPAVGLVEQQPLGVVLSLSPWNYPLQLLFSPVIGALAAGNAVVVKPSEIAGATAALVADLVPRYLAPDAVAVVTGGVPETSELLRERFDHIIYTGGGEVGKVILHAAAEHLTPVTLELGGKSPVFVDETTDLAIAARRIAWGKFANAGQTCVSPDYVLITPGARERFLDHLRRAIAASFGADPQHSPAYGRMINERHFDRVAALLASGTVALGGQTDRADRYIAPTVLTDVALDSPIMGEEIFGPLLPLVTVADADAAIEVINARPHPLALYVFSADRAVRRAFRERTTSGGLVEGAPLVHLSCNDLPFGGVGGSGMGHYRGRASIETFSHERSVLLKPLWPDTLEFVYPPYTGLRRTIRKVMMPIRGGRDAGAR